MTHAPSGDKTIVKEKELNSQGGEKVSIEKSNNKGGKRESSNWLSSNWLSSNYLGMLSYKLPTEHLRINLTSTQIPIKLKS